MTFGQSVRKYRLEREWTIDQLSARTRVSKAAISKIENNRVKPHELTIFKIRQALPDFDAVVDVVDKESGRRSGQDRRSGLERRKETQTTR